MPYFSIIIPTFNRAKYIARAIESVLSQSFVDYELIIVDDASKDNTAQTVKAFNDKRIIYIKNDENKERCVSRNIGIAKSVGKYICFLDSDDYHLPDHLESLYQFIKTFNEPIALFFTNAWNEDMEGNRMERCCPDFTQYNPYTYFLHYTVNPQRWAVHRSVFEKIKFDPEVIICEDMDTSLRILTAGFPVYQLKERTTVYVESTDSFTVSDKNKAEKELFYLKKIFAKKELKEKLPANEKRRLLSMCYYHLTIKAFNTKQKAKVLVFAVKSFLLCPKGYNGKTNRSLLVMVIYSIPLIGGGLKRAVVFLK